MKFLNLFTSTILSISAVAVASSGAIAATPPVSGDYTCTATDGNRETTLIDKKCLVSEQGQLPTMSEGKAPRKMLVEWNDQSINEIDFIAFVEVKDGKTSGFATIDGYEGFFILDHNLGTAIFRWVDSGAETRYLLINVH